MRDNRLFYAANSLAGFLLIGFIYAWSVFVGPLESEFGWARAQTSLNFSICMVMFCLGGLAASKLSRGRTPRQIMLLSAGLILASFELCARMRSLPERYLGFGIMGGMGVGLAYNVLLTATLGWFPDRPGLISGFLLMGFGFSGSLIGALAAGLIPSLGWRATFMALGLGIAALLSLIALNVKRPGQSPPARLRPDNPEAELAKNLDMLRGGPFYAYYVRAALVGAVGLAMVGHAVPFAHSIASNAVTAATIGGLITIFNGLGRITGGNIFDRLGSRGALWIGLAGMALALIILIYAASRSSLAALTAGYVLGGFFYGYNIPCHASFIGQVYGQRNFSANFSILNTYILISSFIGPYAVGLMFARSGSYAASYTLLLALAGLALAANTLIKRHYIPLKVLRCAKKN